jgi:hypothetical protein
VAGVNRYLAETGVDNLPEGEEGCRGKSWVRPITVLDLGSTRSRASIFRLPFPVFCILKRTFDLIL